MHAVQYDALFLLRRLLPQVDAVHPLREAELPLRRLLSEADAVHPLREAELSLR